jgi:hypothetical protein
MGAMAPRPVTPASPRMQMQGGRDFLAAAQRQMGRARMPGGPSGSPGMEAGAPPAAPGLSSRISPGTVPMKKGMR